jgi:hypothetical protein
LLALQNLNYLPIYPFTHLQYDPLPRPISHWAGTHHGWRTTNNDKQATSQRRLAHSPFNPITSPNRNFLALTTYTPHPSSPSLSSNVSFLFARLVYPIVESTTQQIQFFRGGRVQDGRAKQMGHSSQRRNIIIIVIVAVPQSFLLHVR